MYKLKCKYQPPSVNSFSGVAVRAEDHCARNYVFKFCWRQLGCNNVWFNVI